MSAAVAPPEDASRSDRRKRATRERLLVAAMGVFLRRGFDGATTAEIAAAADLGAGTFYLHFSDKRDVFETLARRSAREMIEAWRAGQSVASSLADIVASGLEAARDFWSADRARARLLLDGGPSFSSQAHLHLVEYLADVMGPGVEHLRDADPRTPSADVVATLSVAIALEIGRMVAGSEDSLPTQRIDDTIRFVREMLS